MTKHRFKAKTLPALSMVGPVSIWLLVFVAAPLVYVLIMSFCGLDEFYNVSYHFTFANYKRLVNVNYLNIYLHSLIIALVTTVICILVGYPFAYIIARTKSKRKNLLYMLVIIPFWTNSLIRIYGWKSLLGTTGWINTFLMNIHLIKEPIEFLYK